MRLTLLAVFAAALLAAVSAHIGIDVAGDYVLRHDYYDDVAHGSRTLFTAIALLCAAGAGVTLLRRVFADMKPIRNRPAWFGAVGALALAIVPLMETIDALRAGDSVGSLADAFGGSLLLGGGITLAAACTICSLLFALVAWLCRHRLAVVRLVEALIAPHRSPPPEYAARARASLITRARELRAQRRSKRGPPDASRHGLRSAG